MSDRSLPARQSVCDQPELNMLVAPYCFGDLDKDRQRAFEIHFLKCDVCWNQVAALEPAAEALAGGQTAAPPAFAAMLTKVFGGHLSYVLPICIVYAALFPMALVLELAYEIDRFRPSLLVVVPLVFLWVLSTSILGLGLDWKLTLAGKASGLFVNLGIQVGAATILYLAMMAYLPSVSFVPANFQTLTAQAAFLKSMIHLLLLSMIFWLPSFHFVISMQREILAGRHRLALALLTNDTLALKPRGTIFPRLSWLIALWVVFVLARLGGMFYLFNNLKPDPSLNLYMNIAVLHQFLFFVVGTGCLIWYSRALEVLKRECLALLAFQTQLRAVGIQRDL